MHSRRNVLAAISSVAIVGTAGCLSSYDGSQASGGLEMRNRQESRTEAQYVYEIDLDEGEWDYVSFESPGRNQAIQHIQLDSGNVAGRVMSNSHFRDNYRESDTVSSYAQEVSASDGRQSTAGLTEGHSEWVFVVDNTGYLSHNPDGYAGGQANLILRRV